MTACGGKTSGSSPTAASTCFDGRRHGPWCSRSKVSTVGKLIDPKVELATKLGLEIFYPIVHFNLPSWLASNGEKHAVFADSAARSHRRVHGPAATRYKFRLVIPVVEVQMDAFQRGRVGNWQPHGKSASSYTAIYNRLVHAYKASARVAKMHGATVFCSEPATEVQTVLDLSDVTDIAGIDLYPHMHKQRSIIGFFRWWWQTAHLPLCISEFGTPETYDPVTEVDEFNKFVPAGVDDNRIATARLLADALRQAKEEGIPDSVRRLVSRDRQHRLGLLAHEGTEEGRLRPRGSR